LVLLLEQSQQKIRELKDLIFELSESLNLPKLKEEAEKLNRLSQENGFWDDAQQSQVVLTALKEHNELIDSFEELTTTHASISELLYLVKSPPYFAARYASICTQLRLPPFLCDSISMLRAFLRAM